MSEPRWDLVYKWSTDETRSLVDRVVGALEVCDRKLSEIEHQAALKATTDSERYREALEEILEWFHNDNIRPGTFVFKVVEIARSALTDEAAPQEGAARQPERPE